MIIDNKKDRYPDDGLQTKTVWDFLLQFNGADKGQTGHMDIVTGFFTISALARMAEELPEGDRFRLISSEMLTREDDKDEHIIDLLSDNAGGIEEMFKMKQKAEQAIRFLQRENVDVRAILKAFCHAKAYLFKNDVPQNDSFYLTGSSNLTDAGLGLFNSANIELNIGNPCKYSDKEFKELCGWYQQTWDDAQKDIAADPANRKAGRISIKQHFVNKINEHYREYTPWDIYYKILYEMFGADIELDDNTREHMQDFKTLEGSVIWRTLFKYQQAGVVSLIKMLRRYGGAILADAVGLGKTFSALAVVKYFATQGYTTLLLCPKKLEQNWTQYLKTHGSRFENDEFDYTVRFHSDLQDDRLESSYDAAKLSWLRSRNKLLVVIDESHNLRNEKSSRYKYLLQNLIAPDEEHPNRQVKVLMLSATPINTGLRDIKGQFNLIAQGQDNAFDTDELGHIGSLKQLFSEGHRKYKAWLDNPQRTIGDFVEQLPTDFFTLTDRLVVARTRHLIETTLGESLGFPDKLPPENIYIGVDHLSKKLQTVDDIYDAFDGLTLTAYLPKLYIPASTDVARAEAQKDWSSDVHREQFLVKMMCVLFMKRLESSWHSCLLTVRKVYQVHNDTLAKVVNYIEKHDNAALDDYSPDGFDADEDEQLENFDVSLHKGTVSLSEMQNIDGFRKGLEADIKKLRSILEALETFNDKYHKGEERDRKLDRLVETLRGDRKTHKYVIFTAYADTAAYLYDELQKRGFGRIAMVTGTQRRASGDNPTNDLSTILQRFAPYSKLYKEKDWTQLYEQHLSRADYCDQNGRWDVSYSLWLELIKKHLPTVKSLIDDPIDILIATDCLSEGQNLQDADVQVNYDIHWNPVRLIQRFGRIDRIGSPNDAVRCVNFWPSDSFDAYLKLIERVEGRMSIMAVVGTEVSEQMSDEFKRIMEDNPLIEKSSAALLDQLRNNSISDIEDSQTPALSDLSLDLFRQDLREFFEQYKDQFRRMPAAIFSGFTTEETLFERPEQALVALIGYPKRDNPKTPYKAFYLMYVPDDTTPADQIVLLNAKTILTKLRDHKLSPRFVPEDIDHGEPTAVSHLISLVDKGLEAKAPQKKREDVLSLFAGTADDDTELNDNMFRKEECDLITWEYISKQQ